MCTLTIMPASDGLIVTMNRDENRDRTEGETLRRGSVRDTDRGERVRYCHPVDRRAGGTWFGVNNQGVIAALLNRYQEPQKERAESRGHIIPRLLGTTADEMNKTLGATAWQAYNPFDLLLLLHSKATVYSWTGTGLQQRTLPLDAPILFTSSSREADSVAAYRKQRFTDFTGGAAQQPMDADSILHGFHLVRDRQDPSSSVFMERPDHHTKSICQAIFQNRAISLFYFNEEQLTQLASAGRLRPACRSAGHAFEEELR